MSLSPGQTLAHYEVIDALGSGAMGEVWRARDTRLGREVAVKILPPRFADDAERLQRFEREARSVASLNHPRVAQIHDVGQVDDLCFLVLELIPGETLEDRIARGALPVDEALDVCAQIADALDAAHEAGVVHRDLKPANVRLTPDGGVKLLDFGLARFSPTGDEAASDAADSVLSTEAGRLLGTPTYMSPEQARGRAIDRRVDVWALGCVLFECLTARRAFAGESLSDVLAAVLEREPDWSALPPLPTSVDTLLRRCLVKDPRRRLRDAGEARLLLEDPDGAAWGGATGGSNADDRRSRSPTRTLLVMLLLVTLTALATHAWFGDPAAPVVDGPLHLAIEPPPDTRVLFSGDFAGPPVVSPDGSALAFCAQRENDVRRLWIRRLDEPDARELPGTDNALFPFWSPDSREIAFFAGPTLLRYDVTNDTLDEVTQVGSARGGTYTGDGRIVYASNFRSGLFVIDVEGGEPVPLTTLDEDLHTSHRWPSMIAGTDRFVFVAVTPVVGEEANNGLYLGSLDGSPPQRLMASNAGAQVVDDLLLHVKDGNLLATAFDVHSGELRGPATTVARGLATDASTWHAQFSASAAGVLVLNRPSAGPASPSRSAYNWAFSGDRVSHWSYEGRHFTTYGPGRPIYSMALSPGGDMLAVDAVSPDGLTDIWLYTTPRGAGPGDSEGADQFEERLTQPPAPQRLTFLPGVEILPVWSPDGDEVAFRWDGDDERPRGIYRKRIGGGSEVLVRDNRGADDHPSSWTPDGRYLIVTTGTILLSPGNDIIAVPLDGGPERPLLTGPAAEFDGRVSPDGRWLAYVSSGSGGSVFVTPFAPAWPDDRSDERWAISTTNGFMPRWSADGEHLYYTTETGTLVEVDVETSGETFSASSARSLFQSSWRVDRTYDPYPDDDGSTIGFVFLDSDEAAEGPISVVLGWQALLDR